MTDTPAPTGYLHASYAASLAEFGTPRRLTRSGGWLLVRDVPGTGARDAMGCYPLFCCLDWSGLEDDLDALDDVVCVSLVTDPFGAGDEASLRRCFGDVMIPFKLHFVTDLATPIDRVVSRHHRYYARKALERVTVERCTEPERFLDGWVDLYSQLIARHDLRGVQAFSAHAFAAQLRIPGAVMLRATHEGAMIGADLWYSQGDVMYSHLAAVNAVGYKLMASYALHWFALQTFAEEARWLNLGAGSGLAASSSGGLSRFKRGWSTGTRPAYYCGRIVNPGAYAAIVDGRQTTKGGYFPAYRRGEFA